MPDAHGIRPAFPGIYSTRSRAEGTHSPVRSSLHPAWTPPLTHSYKTTTKHFWGDLSFSPGDSRRVSVLFIYIVCEAQPRRTSCVFARRGRTSLVKQTQTKTKTLSSCRPPVFYFLSVFFFRFIPCCQYQEPGTELRRWQKTRFVIEALSLFYWIYFAVEEKDPGAERCAKNSRGLPHLFSLLPPSIPPSINLSLYRPLSFYLSICFHVLGPFDFAKMHHQQRMAALGTDKELSDLLDFSAVSECTFVFFFTNKVTLMTAQL